VQKEKNTLESVGKKVGNLNEKRPICLGQRKETNEGVKEERK
jgi:hypothetical protein